MTRLGYLLKYFGYKLAYKISSNIWRLSGQLYRMALFILKFIGYIFDKFGENWATFWVLLEKFGLLFMYFWRKLGFFLFNYLITLNDALDANQEDVEAGDDDSFTQMLLLLFETVLRGF